ncbi:MAG: hypothetical protein J6B43_00195 [Lachnospiraceae bacterium]|nr:hypothetical protein [Lachnospiraceae bacterium]
MLKVWAGAAGAASRKWFNNADGYHVPGARSCFCGNPDGYGLPACLPDCCSCSGMTGRCV